MANKMAEMAGMAGMAVGQGGMPDLTSLMGMFQNGMGGGNGIKIDESKVRKEKKKLQLQKKECK